ncbi:MAG: ATP-binding protein [Deltaproteobacteria bacterium]|nr:ATP-binding protein [Deltaproteobacteria bacterium]
MAASVREWASGSCVSVGVVQLRSAARPALPGIDCGLTGRRLLSNCARMVTQGPRLNPFQPDAPARASIFSGRTPELKSIETAIVDTLRGHPSHVLIVGERGMGKTSLARYVENLAQSPAVWGAAGVDVGPAVLFVSLGFSATIPDACAAILSEAYRWAQQRGPSMVTWFQNELSKLEGVSVGFFGVTAAVKAGGNTLPWAFPGALESFVQRSEKAASGLVIILDETESIAADPQFAPFIKSLLETLGQRRVNTVQLVVTATPEGRDRMNSAHPSFSRLFRPLNVGRLADSEVRVLVHKALQEGWPKKTADEAFLSSMCVFASGIPGFVHEIGKATFDVDTDNHLTEADFTQGVIGTDQVVGAMDVLEQKHFMERYSKKVLSNSYREVLHAMALAERDLKRAEIPTEEIRKRCPTVTQPGPYLANMVKRGVISRVDGKRGTYQLPDRMFYAFLLLGGTRRSRKAAHL